MQTSSTSDGFTLVELLVSIGIMLVIMSVIVFGQSHYTGAASVEGQAQEMSLALREAQVYGVSVKETAPGTNNFAAAYGVEWNILGSGSNDAYISFVDLNGNGIYDSGWSCPSGGGSECLNKNMLLYGNTIASLCALDSTGSCGTSLGRVDITFLRPATEAQIVYYNQNGSQISSSGLIGAEADLVSTGGVHKTVSIFSSGQVSVQ